MLDTQAAIEKLIALSDEQDQCWVFGSDAEVDGENGGGKVDVSCLRLIRGTLENGETWTEEMCCLPCRLRAIVKELKQPEGKCFITPGVHEPGCELYKGEVNAG